MENRTSVYLCYLEEDNPEAGYFRVLPLISAAGPFSFSVKDEWPDIGSLRIVPDRSEQKYFKDRLRAIGNFCLVDLSNFDPSQHKIRTNKNYNPDKGESNRYILFSDAIKPLTGQYFKQVLANEQIEKAVTPWVVTEEDGARFSVRIAVPDSKSAVTDELTTFTVSCPDGVERTFAIDPEVESPQPVHRVNQHQVETKPKQENLSTGDIQEDLNEIRAVLVHLQLHVSMMRAQLDKLLAERNEN